MKFSEQAVVLGEQKSLVGIITQAVGPGAPANDLAVVILNTGIIHRVGHHRMYVSFSRALADAGYTVLRFDFSGIGDSDKRVDSLPPFESNLSDIEEAIDWLEVTGQIKRVVLLGLCSGADNGLLYAASDPRVVGLVLMDPSIPPTRRYFREYVSRRLLRGRSFLSFAFGRSHIRKMLVEFTLGSLARDWAPRYPTVSHPKIRRYLESVYQATVDRGVKFLVVLSGGGQHIYPEQLLDAFPNVSFLDQLHLESFDDSDHIFTSGADRSKLLTLILKWLMATNFRKATMINGYLLVNILGGMM
jgi:pimeloyl-ACP methyl ester carboxylesterase